MLRYSISSCMNSLFLQYLIIRVIKGPALVPLDYLIHSFGEWGCVSVVYFPRVGPKGPALVRFHVIKKFEL